MYASTSFTSHIVHDLVIQSHSRRLLMLPNPLAHHDSSPPPTNNNSTHLYLGNSSFDANVVMVLSVLLCALICSLGLNAVIRCALRCSDLVINDSSSSSNPSPSSSSSSSRLANTGIKKKALKTFPIITYESTELNKVPGLDTECVICLSDFTNGEKLRILPKCNHGFHVSCIDKWLTSHSSCPKCRHCLIHTCQKIVGGTTHPPPPLPQTIISIEPLDPETMVRNYT
ncbi:hypothetical protein HN51_036968 [Arachis hypogaea]|uniref:RING-H2 finger protein ATL78 n=1 Tax=Arachis ipaensis TaxID=130454 RepID=UPI0007AFD6CE|nr:RING-H2 finger protein ATL78 [Arachis ipaensis]XP_025637800.1 RING-H2 finger protein ATL78 [Arachis hypogaea]QHO02431.1 RING-H2 finger protein [Arachis hypogaea]